MELRHLETPPRERKLYDYGNSYRQYFRNLDYPAALEQQRAQSLAQSGMLLPVSQDHS